MWDRVVILESVIGAKSTWKGLKRLTEKEWKGGLRKKSLTSGGGLLQAQSSSYRYLRTVRRFFKRRGSSSLP